MDRRSMLAAIPAITACPSIAANAFPDRAMADQPLPGWYSDLEERTFRWFWDLADRRTGLVPDRWPSPSFCSIAAVGFALTAYPIGVERGWCSRADARDLTLATLRFFDTAPQGEAVAGTSGHRGFFYHFLDMQTGTRFRHVELSSVDSTLLFLGMLFAAQYFDGSDPAEVEIRRLANAIYRRADWPWFRANGRSISMGWHPESGFIERAWEGYNEGMMVVILALGSPTYPIADDGWAVWAQPYARFWRGDGATRHLAFAPLFGHQYSHVWIDFRDIQDAPMRAAGLNYFENSRRATFANRAYCIANPMGWSGYSRDVWGLTACDGPGEFRIALQGRERQFHGYAARGPIGQPDGLDDGTLAPTAALAALPFAPEIVIPCADALRRVPGLYGQYGFRDSFNPSFTGQVGGSPYGSVSPQDGWVAQDYIGIDQGPILAMAANYRANFIWGRMQACAPIRTGLVRAGFSGGWLDQDPRSATQGGVG